MGNLLDQNSVLTREVLERENNLFEFLLLDTPFPEDFWPRREDVKDLIFLNIGESLMEHMLDCFKVGDLFDYYGITNYSADPDPRKLMENLDEMAASLRRMTSIDELRASFGDDIDRLLAAKPRTNPGQNILNDHWKEVVDDFVRILSYLKSYCQQALETRRTIAILGM